MSQNIKKLKRGKIFRKSLVVPKKMEGGNFGLAGYGMLRGKTGKSFLVSSLDHIVQFGAIIFRRTFVELFWSVRLDWKKKKSHYNSRVSLHEAPTKKSNVKNKLAPLESI